MPHLLCEETDGIATLTLNRPEVRNAVDDEIMSSLSGHTERLAGDERLRAVIVTGAGDEAFCAGGDLKWLQTFETGEAGESMSRRMQGILDRLSNLPVPVIGVLNGYALGGGTEIALACDMRIMEEHAYLSFKQARVGLTTAWGGGGRLLRLVGFARAMELLTTCRDVPGQKAIAFGLANAVVPKGEGLAKGRQMAEEITKGAPHSIRSIKRLLREADGMPLAEAADLEARLFREVWTSADHDEAIQAFFEKREPRFRGK
ncbi:MAG: enoyl-CoA hydratase-related protein [bacterium]